MIRSLLMIGLMFLSCTSCKEQTETEPRYKVWYRQAAQRFEEALPLGNGRLGAMPDGGVTNEKIILNEISLWSGCVTDNNNPEASKSLPEIRELLKAGRNREAQDLVYRTFVCSGGGSANPRYGSYQILGNLNVKYQYPGVTGTVLDSDYKRELNLESAIAHTQYKIGKELYKRTYFTSFADDVLVVRWQATEPNLNFELSIDRPERFLVTANHKLGELQMEGELLSGVAGVSGMKYMSRMRIVCDGEQLLTDSTIIIRDASEAVLYLSAATNYQGGDEEQTSLYLLEKAMEISYKKLLSRHRAVFEPLFSRADIMLGEAEQPNAYPTNHRLIAFAADTLHSDTYLPALYYQFGRYLLLSSARQGLLPPNLQGLWANTIRTPWNGDYHMNINVQMNHWPCEVSNLAETHLPFIEQTKSLVEPGRETAKVFYKANGWVAHMMTNIWGFTAPGEHPSWGATNTGGAWNCQHLWEHYAFQPDMAYLKEVYPVLREASNFFLDVMIEEPRRGWLVTAPSTSPENAYLLDGRALSVCMGPTMDIQIIRELFTNTIEAAKILGIDQPFSERLSIAREKLPPHQIGKYGQLMEWLNDYEEADVHHRHVSHLYGLFPGNQITPESTPELAAAARKTLERRGDDGVGWSKAWKINFWARLKDGKRAYRLLCDLLHPATGSTDGGYHTGGGTYPNLFDACPPFQIDGNFGGCSGVSEMLLQSHAGFIEFLPALPAQWHTGSFRGLRVRGGAEIDACWKSSELEAFEMRATALQRFKLKLPYGNWDYIKNEKKIATPFAKQGYVEIVLDKGDKLHVSRRLKD